MKDFLRNNGILILIIALLLSLITAVLTFTFGGIANPFANLAGVVATPFRNGFHGLVSWTEGVYSDALAGAACPGAGGAEEGERQAPGAGTGGGGGQPGE